MEPQYLKAIEREARLLNSLKHPALPRVSDHFTEENGQFLVMEYIAGDDLSEMMERSGKAFSVEEVLNWADQLLDALEFLHTQEIPVIHRDIKPQNLKLTPRGQIVLLDFGLAKGNANEAAHQTASKSIFGYSRNYASLEQIQGTGTDPHSDLYSLAATLYHLLVGIEPHDALTRAMHVLSEKNDPLEPANFINPQIPQGVAAVLHNAMALNSNQRPPSAKAMRQMLRDNEKYANLITVSAMQKAKSDAAAATRDAAGRATKLLPLAENNQTDVKTKILSGDIAADTVLRKSSPNTETESVPTTLFASSNATKPGEPKRRSAFAAVALGGLLLVGVGASAVYLVSPEDSSDANAAGKTSEVQTAVAAENVAPEKQNLATSPANNVVAVAESAAVPRAGQETPKQTAKNPSAGIGKNTEAAKSTAKNNGKSGSKSGADDGDEDESMRVVGETVYLGDMKITDERIETPNVIVDENGMRLKNVSRPPTQEEIKRLENQIKRRALRNAMKYRQIPLPPKSPPAEPEEKP